MAIRESMGDAVDFHTKITPDRRSSHFTHTLSKCLLLSIFRINRMKDKPKIAMMIMYIYVEGNGIYSIDIERN